LFKETSICSSIKHSGLTSNKRLNSADIIRYNTFVFWGVRL